MAISGKCKKVTTNYNRVVYGVNPRVETNSRCRSYGYANMTQGKVLICDCQIIDGQIIKNDGYCLWDDEYIVSTEVTDDSNCGSCIPPEKRYDCINGNCVDSGVYKTPGQYATLEECQGNCGGNTNSCKPPFECIDPTNFCPPGKVCVPQDEWNQIGSLIQQNIRKHCH